MKKCWYFFLIVEKHIILRFLFRIFLSSELSVSYCQFLIKKECKFFFWKKNMFFSFILKVTGRLNCLIHDMATFVDRTCRTNLCARCAHSCKCSNDKQSFTLPPDSLLEQVCMCTEYVGEKYGLWCIIFIHLCRTKFL